MNSPVSIWVVWSCSVATILHVATAAAGSPSGSRAHTIHPEKELLITNAAVLDSDRARYPGPWSFGALIEELVGKEKAPDVIRAWLETWTRTVKLNGQTVPARPLISQKVIGAWQKRDGFDGNSGVPWKPKLENAPFRLLAIVNRMDLGAPRLAKTLDDVKAQWQMSGHGDLFSHLLSRTTAFVPLKNPEISPEATEAVTSLYYDDSQFNGEGRLIFGAIDTDGKPLAGDWTIIFEYALPAATTPDEEPWPRRWHGLGEFELGDERFGEALAAVTCGFTTRNAVGRAPTLAQLRTSEAAFGPGREFRQFVLRDGALRLSVLPQTPAPEFMVKRSREQRALASFLDGQSALIRAGIGGLPRTIEVGGRPAPLLAARALIPADDPAFCWDFGRAVQPDPRRLFSLNTCNGCHAGETRSWSGLHVRPRAAGEEAQLSEFLRFGTKGLRLDDPAARGSKIEYQEMEDRMAIFAALLEPKERARLDALRDVLRGRLRRTH